LPGVRGPDSGLECLYRLRPQGFDRAAITDGAAAHAGLDRIGYTATVKAIINEALADARQRLSEAPFQPNTREALLLLGHVLGWTEAQVLARQNEELADVAASHFEQVVNRRLCGEPVAYIVGAKEFYGRLFQVDRRVLIPRPETEHLIELALELPLPPSPRVLDVGTGSGCLACTLGLELPASRIVATDISAGALAVARYNRRSHGLQSRVLLSACDLTRGLDLSGFDLIVSNPPYVGRHEAASLSAEILDFEPDTALFAGANGDDIYRRLFQQLSGLRPETWLVMEIGASQEDLIRRLSAGSPFRLVEVRPDYAGHPRIALLQRH
jgi:release factor glutamine methyltransferase